MGDRARVAIELPGVSGVPCGVRVRSADTNSDGIDDIIATPAGALPHVMIIDGASGTAFWTASSVWIRPAARAFSPPGSR